MILKSEPINPVKTVNEVIDKETVIQLYPDNVTVERLIQILDLQTLRYDSNISIYDGTPTSRDVILTYTPEAVIYLEINGLTQLDTTYTIVDKTVTYNGDIDIDDVINVYYAYGVELQNNPQSFLQLTDTPTDYTGQAGKAVIVNAQEDGTDFISVAGTGDMTKIVYDPNNINADVFNYDNFINTPTIPTPLTDTDDLPEGVTNLYYTDTRVSLNPDVLLNTADRHNHTNKTLLDSLTDIGTGDNYLSDDGSYKSIVSSGGDMTKAVYDPTGINSSSFDYNNFINTPVIPTTTTQITEGSNLYYTDTRADARIISLVSTSGLSGSYTDLLNIPTEFNPSTHTHLELDITNLDKYTQVEVNNLLTPKADITYVDTQDVILQDGIDGKANLVHTHIETDITDLDKYTQAEVNNLLTPKADTSYVDAQDLKLAEISTEDELTGRMKLATVAVMPGTPDADTIYFVI